jgi:outer membrane receptor protein involved in Fe transport
VEIAPISVTATRQPQDVFNLPAPVHIVDSARIRQLQPENAADLFRGFEGLDVNGVGPSQERPTIRGLSGQRILLLEDGVRLNNSRRQQDFGEVPSLIDVSSLQQVDVVRGPSSVLYGTDAIGGVVNLVTRVPVAASGPGVVHGAAQYRYSSVGDLQRGEARLDGHTGRFNFLLGGAIRGASEYNAPAGTFGDLTFSSRTRVHDAGVKDKSLTAYLGYRLGERQTLFARVEAYRADSAGFGYVDPALLGADQPFIQIRYPRQDWTKYTAGYTATGLNSFLADKLALTGYYQQNKRDLTQNIFVPFGPGTPPGAGIQVNTHNYTDLGTGGFRAEATRIAGARQVLTYGVDFFNDHSDNTDSSAQTVIGFGPPVTTVDDTANVPNATLSSVGLFLQDQIHLFPALTLTVGGRFQSIHAAPRATPDIDSLPAAHTNNTVVGSAGLVYGLTPTLNLIGAVGRGFRAPNLVERYFNGVTPEGSAVQVASPDLRPETSLNVDLGARFRWRRVALEGFVFRNEIHDGIAIAARGDSLNGFPVYQNVNVDRLRYQGVELSGEVALPAGFGVAANYSYIKSKDVNNPDNPIGDTYSSKINLALRYRHPSGRLWAEYSVRHNGEQKDVPQGSSPVGPTLPQFTVMGARAGVSLFRIKSYPQELVLGVSNLTNRLYSEAANTSFFRPEPERTFSASWAMGF